MVTCKARVAMVTLVVAASAVSGCSETSDQGQAAGSSTTATVVPSTARAPSTTGAPSTTATTSRDLSEQSRLRLDGIGPVTVGMTVAEASRRVGRTVKVIPDSLVDPTSECGFADVEGGPDGLWFRVLRSGTSAPWRITRVDVVDPSRIATGAGIRIGSTEDEVRRTYGDRIQVATHEYDPNGHYLTLDTDGEAGNLLLFETDGMKVTQFRSGEQDSAAAVEGCL
jgi:hypothetical protein